MIHFLLASHPSIKHINVNLQGSGSLVLTFCIPVCDPVESIISATISPSSLSFSSLRSPFSSMFLFLFDPKTLFDKSKIKVMLPWKLTTRDLRITCFYEVRILCLQKNALTQYEYLQCDEYP